MSEKIDVQLAIKEAMQTEKDAMDFYKFGAEKMSDDKAKKTFELLAREEAQHAHSFYNIYKGTDIPSFDDFINAPPDTTSSWWRALQKLMMGDFDERKALELAIEEEEALEKQLRSMAEKMTDPEVKAIYLANANSTHHHFEVISEDYADIYGM